MDYFAQDIPPIYGDWGMVEVLPTLLGGGVQEPIQEPIPCRLGTQGHMHLHRTRACHHLVDPSHADVAWQVAELLDQVLPCVFFLVEIKSMGISGS